MNVLLTPENSNQLKLSIDNATGNVKAVLKDIESNRGKHYVQPFEVYTPTYQEARKAEYTGGKAGIGPFALNNAHHILTLLTKLKMVTDPFTTALGLYDLGKIWDDPTPSNPKGGRILDWLSAMINGFVDIAKDPYIVRLNVNGWTYNMVSFLLRTGKGKSTFYFMSQPILKEMAEAALKTKGKYGIDRTKSPSLLEKEAIEAVLDKYDPNKVYRKLYEYIISDPIKAASTYRDLFEEITNPDTGEPTYKTRELLKKEAKEDPDYNRNLVAMYYAFKALKPYADAVADLVKYSKVDTKKTGKSFAEQLIYRYGMKDLKKSPYFGRNEIVRFYDETFIETKTKNSIDFGYSIFANLLFRNTNIFTERLSNILSLLGRKSTATKKILSPIIKGMESQMKSEFFNNIGIDINSLLTGEQSVPKRLNNFKLRILRGDYPELLRYDGTIANDFLEYLLPNIGSYKGYDFIDTSEIIQGDLLQADNLINYWRDLLEHPDSRVRKLAEDLAIYAFYTSGDNAAMNSFFKYLPNSYRITSGYNDFIKSKLHNMINNGEIGTFDKMDILANNWSSDAVVKPINYYKQSGDGYVMMKHISIDEYQTAPNLILGEYGNGKIGISPIGWIKVKGTSYPLFPPMVKFRDLGGYAPENWHLYQLIGYKESLSDTGKVNYTPVYALINKKGMKYKGHTIVEYGRETALPFNLENLAYFDLMDHDSILPYTGNSEEWRSDLNKIHYINELPSYTNLNYAKAEHDRIFEEEDVYDDMNDTPLGDAEEPSSTSQSESKVDSIVYTDINNTESTDNDPVNFNNQAASEAILSSDKTILTNEELNKIRPFSGDNPRIAVASEHTDPVFFADKIISILDGIESVEDKFRNTTYSGKDFAALYLITKHDGLPLKKLLEYKIPKIIHFSITGLGGTMYEPGVLKPDDLLDRIAEFVEQGLDPEMITVRIDPIIPGVTGLNVIENIIKRSSEIGIKNIRFSVMDQYKTTKQFMEKLGYDYSKFYEPGKLHAKDSVLKSIAETMRAFKDKYNVNLSTCAEPFDIAGISKEACLSVPAVNKMLGTSIPDTATGKQRKLCSCYGGKTDLLRYDNKCASSCVYCYAHHNTDKNAMYYNKDGTLKDIPLTRTVEKQDGVSILKESVALSTLNKKALITMELYEIGDRRIKEVLSSLELTEEERQTYLNEFAETLRNENVSTIEQVEGVINKFICNL